MARAMGAAVVDMQYIQVHPTSFIDPKNPTDKSKFLAAEALRGKGAILVCFISCLFYYLLYNIEYRLIKKEKDLVMN